MRPLILQRKVFLALLAIVIAAVSIGSALNSEGTLHGTFGTPPTVLSLAICAKGNFATAIRHTGPNRPFRRELRRLCAVARRRRSGPGAWAPTPLESRPGYCVEDGGSAHYIPGEGIKPGPCPVEPGR